MALFIPVLKPTVYHVCVCQNIDLYRASETTHFRTLFSPAAMNFFYTTYINNKEKEIFFIKNMKNIICVCDEVSKKS